MYPYPKKQTICEFVEKHHPKSGLDPWINYCEICIDKEGNIYECIPSHQEFALSYMSKKEGMTREEVIEKIPIYASPIHYVAEKYQLLFLWNNLGIAYEGYDTDIVSDILKKLEELNLIKEKKKKNGFVMSLSYEYSYCKNRGDV